MFEFEPFLVSLVGVLLGGGFSALAATITKRFAEPSSDEISQAETYASEALLLRTAEDGRAIEDAGSGGAPPEPAPAAPQGGDAEALRILTAYAEDLQSEAGRIARRSGADSASATHVRLAADRLGLSRQTTSAVADVGLAAGGLVLGGAASFWINLLTGGDASPGATPWVIGVGAFGLTVFMVSATVKWVRR